MLLGRLARVCSALAHWAPVFIELAYLPSFVFPFLKAIRDQCSLFLAAKLRFLLVLSSTVKVFSAIKAFFNLTLIN